MTWSPMVAVTQYAPSADETTQGVLLEADNIIPTERGWRSAYSLSTVGMESLTATCVGSALCTLMDASRVMVAGTASKLWVRSGATWADKTASGVTLHATPDLRWRFAMMGNYILAATSSDTIQVSDSGGTFVALASAPQASLIESVYGFIMAADTNEATYGDQSDRWWCSALFDHTDWTPSTATQCTSGRLVDTPGPITGLRRLGANVAVYKENSLYLGQYVEPPVVWDFNLISSNVGCASHDAIVNIGRAHLFPGYDNFYIFDGASVQPIGEPVRQWFFEGQLYRAYDVRIQAVHDFAKSLIYWFYPVSGDTADLKRCVVYNYKLDRWGVATYSIESGVDYVAAGITYDGLGTYFSTYDAGIDRTYDSPLWVPDQITPAVFDSTHVLKTLDGPGTTSSFVSWHFGDDQQFTLLRRARIRWLDDPTTAVMTHYYCNEHGSAFTLRGTATQSNNKFDLMHSARWHRIKFDMTGTHEFSALAVDVVPQGAW